MSTVSVIEDLDRIRKEAMMFRWLRDNAKEGIFNPRGYNSEICPDTRLEWKIPTLISYNAIGDSFSFEEALEIKMGINK